jgi:hypothetical protein
MKRYLLVLLMAVAAFGFVGCGAEDETKADLRWDNQNGSGDDLINISWSSSGNSDQTWDRADDGAGPTAYKGITELAGTGDAVIDGGGTALLQLSAGTGVNFASGSAATIQENASATLIITSAK